MRNVLCSLNSQNSLLAVTQFTVSTSTSPVNTKFSDETLTNSIDNVGSCLTEKEKQSSQLQKKIINVNDKCVRFFELLELLESPLPLI